MWFYSNILWTHQISKTQNEIREPITYQVVIRVISVSFDNVLLEQV